MFDFLNFKKQIGSVKSQAEDLGKAIKGKQDELQRMRTAPPQKEDVINYFCKAGGVIDRLAGDHEKAFSFAVAPLFKRPLSFEEERDIAVIATQPGPNASASPRSVEAALLFLLRDEIKASLRKAIGTMEWPEDAGPLIAKRLPMIESAERELAALIAEQENLRQQLAETGIIIG